MPTVTCSAQACVTHTASASSDLLGLLVFVAIIGLIGWVISRD